MSPADELDGITANRVTRRIIALARDGGLRPELDPSGPCRGAHRIIVNGDGRDGLFGAIYVSVRKGRVLRAVLTHGNHGQERRYETVAGIRDVLKSWVALERGRYAYDDIAGEIDPDDPDALQPEDLTDHELAREWAEQAGKPWPPEPVCDVWRFQIISY